MIWGSINVPRVDGRRRLSDHNHRDRHGRRHRRLPILESLEGRTLLSNVTVTVSNTTLSIVGDTHNNDFSVTEGPAGQVTVAAISPTTTINGTSSPFTTPRPVLDIVITLPGTASNSDVVVLSGQGKTTPTGIRNVTVNVTGQESLTFSATSKDDSGMLTINDGTAGISGGPLTATVDDSQFASIWITQTGKALAAVDLANDAVPGNVGVTEGPGSKDQIIASSGDTFGSTLFVQQGSGASTVVGPQGTNSFTYLYIMQTSSTGPVGTVYIDATNVLNDLYVIQDSAGAVNIATTTSSILPPVVVGGTTIIFQPFLAGTVTLGGRTAATSTSGTASTGPYDFTTGALLIYTGAKGGGTTTATNTNAGFAILFSGGSPTSNTYTDGGGNAHGVLVGSHKY